MSGTVQSSAIRPASDESDRGSWADDPSRRTGVGCAASSHLLVGGTAGGGRAGRLRSERVGSGRERRRRRCRGSRRRARSTQVAATGAGWVELTSSWARLEPVNGDVRRCCAGTALDALVSHAKSLGLHVELRLTGAPDWATGATGTGVPPRPAFYGRYAQFLGDLAQRTRPQGRRVGRLERAEPSELLVDTRPGRIRAPAAGRLSGDQGGRPDARPCCSRRSRRPGPACTGTRVPARSIRTTISRACTTTASAATTTPSRGISIRRERPRTPSPTARAGRTRDRSRASSTSTA